MNKLLAITTLSFVLCTHAFAETETLNNSTQFSTDAYQTKTEAFNAGFDLIDNLTSMGDHDLRKKLALFNQDFVHNIVIDDAKVTLSEFSKVRGDINYRASVNVHYQYQALKTE